MKEPVKDLVARMQRELPDTDKNRYDVAYERGRAQARSSFLFGGLLLGSAVGAGLMWLLDPIRGAERRAQLAGKAEELKRDVSRAVSHQDDGHDGFRGPGLDPSAPGVRVPDPIRPNEVAEHGSAGPIAGAGQVPREDLERPT